MEHAIAELGFTPYFVSEILISSLNFSGPDAEVDEKEISYKLSLVLFPTTRSQSVRLL